MKRPVAVIGFSFLFAALAASFLPVKWMGLAAILCLLAFAGFCLQKERKKLVLLGLAIGAIAFLYTGVYQLLRFAPNEALAGPSRVATGTVTKLEEYSTDDREVTITLSRVDGKEIKPRCKVLVKDREDLPIHVGDTLEMQISLRGPMKGEDAAPQKSQGICLVGEIEEIYHVEKPTKLSLAVRLIGLREKLAAGQVAHLSRENAGLARSLLFGDKTKLDASIRGAFSAAGLSHLLAVSGLHLTILSQFALLFFTAVGLGRKKAVYLSLLLVLLFVGLCGFTASATRAGIMLTIYHLGSCLKRQGDSYTSLALAGLIMVLPNPYYVRDVGLMLSFGALLGILLFAKPIEAFIVRLIGGHKKGKCAQFFLSLFSQSLGAIAGTLPMTIFIFGSFPLLAPLANMVAVPLIQPALILCLLLTATAAVPFLGPVASLFGLLTDWMLSAVCWVVKLFALGPIVYFSGEEWYAKAIALLFLGFLFFCLWRKNTRWVPTSLLISAILIGSVTFTLQYAQQRDLQLLIPADGQVLITKGGRSLFIYTGTGPRVLPEDALHKQGLSGVDVAILTSPLGSLRLDGDQMVAALYWGDPVQVIPRNGVGSAKAFTDGAISIGPELTATVQRAGAASAIFIEAAGEQILLLSGAFPLELLPEGWRRGSILLVGQRKGPTGATLAFDYTVILGKEGGEIELPVKKTWLVSRKEWRQLILCKKEQWLVRGVGADAAE